MVNSNMAARMAAAPFQCDRAIKHVGYMFHFCMHHPVDSVNAVYICQILLRLKY